MFGSLGRTLLAHLYLPNEVWLILQVMTEWLNSMEGWLSHPLVADFGTALIAVVLGLIIIRILQGFAVRSIAQTDTRYRVRKFIGLAGYVVLDVTP